jgi:hypothetical protein
MPHCKEIGCKVKNAKYGLIYTKIALFCATHGKNKPNMVDVKHSRCKKEGCESLSPTFNVEVEKKGIYCGKCKEPGMIDVKSPRCQEIDCKSICPSFNFEDKRNILCYT